MNEEETWLAFKDMPKENIDEKEMSVQSSKVL